jgi:hypothetical protein
MPIPSALLALEAESPCILLESVYADSGPSRYARAEPRVSSRHCAGGAKGPSEEASEARVRAERRLLQQAPSFNKASKGTRGDTFKRGDAHGSNSGVRLLP